MLKQTTSSNKRLTLLTVMLLVLGACGAGAYNVGQTDVAEDAGTQTADTDEAAGNGGSGGCTLGPVAGDESFCADALISELAAVPLPDSADQIAVGTPDVGDGRASQDVFFNADVSEVVAFYEEALPGAGFEITFNEGSEEAVTIEFTDPEGRPGSLFIRTAGTHPSQMSIEMRTS